MTPLHLTDVELAEPIRARTGLGRYSALQALVRLHGEPLGEITLPVVNGSVSARAIACAVRDTLFEPLLTTCLRNGLQVPIDERGLALDTLVGTAAPAYDGPTPLVTVAVCTRNRPDDLRRCLYALRKLQYSNLELLVVDNAPSDDRTERLVQARFPGVRYVREPRPGLDWARNRAILEASGELLAYTDDDVLVDPGWVTACVRVFTAAPDVACVTGLVLPAELETEAQRLFEIYGGFGRGFERQWYSRAGHQADKTTVFHHGPGRFGTGANMAFRRDVFATIGGFDPALDVGTETTGGGDLEMYFRVLQEGYTLVYEPAALVRHRHRRDLDGLHRQIETWGRALFAYKARALKHYPEERRGFREMTRWWRQHNARRLARSLFGTSRIPASLVWSEIKTAWGGAAAYRRACAEVRRIEDTFGPQPSLPTGDSLPRRHLTITPSPAG